MRWLESVTVRVLAPVGLVGLGLIGIWLLAAVLGRPLCAEVVFDLGGAVLRLNDRGYVVSVRSAEGAEYATLSTKPAISLGTRTKELAPLYVWRRGDKLVAEFEGGRAEFAVTEYSGFLTVELTGISGVEQVERITLFRLPLRSAQERAVGLNGFLYDFFAIALMSAEPNVRAFYSREELVVEAYQKHGIEHARFGVLATPLNLLEQTIERFESVAGLPSPKPGGVWGKASPLTKRSYFFATGVRESNVDAVLDIARRGGFDTVLIDQYSWCSSTGHYGVNEQNFPDGLVGLKRAVRRFKEAGFRVGLHLLPSTISGPDGYVSPEPDPRLIKDAFTSLAADLDERATFIPTSDSPQAFPAEDGGAKGFGSVLQIDQELIWYTARSTEAPYGFTGCRRGYLGTRAAAHKKGAQVTHVLKLSGYFIFDMDTPLLDEVAENFARVANECDIDMVYFDGVERLQGEDWYYNAKLLKAFYDKFANKDILLQASSVSHYAWHIVSRHASADGSGDLKAFLEQRSPAFLYRQVDRMPLDIGWYYGYDVEATPDQYEYVLAATIGYDSSMSFQVSPDAAGKHPFMGDILDLIARYEKLRLSGRVPAEMRERLRISAELGNRLSGEERAKLLESRREYRLVGEEGREAFQRVIYMPWREVSANDGFQNVWTITVPDGPARVGVQMHVKAGPWLRPGAAYYSSDALLVEDFNELSPYVVATGRTWATADGVTQILAPCDADPKEGAQCAVYTALSSLETADGWAVIGRLFPSPVDLSGYQGIGFWLRGDGNGGKLKLQLRDASRAFDYYVDNNYRGWRYHQFARPKTGGIDFSKVRALIFSYDALPAMTAVSCAIDDVKALRWLDVQAVSNPRVTVGGMEERWGGTIAADQWVIVWPSEPVRRYAVGMEPVQGTEIGPDIVLPAGEHSVKVEFDTASLVALQVRVTVQPPERREVP
jgi:hypothetical protein